jgi:hypothetical protein
MQFGPGIYASCNHAEERDLEWARHTEMMRQMKGAREQIKQKAQASSH